MNDYIVAIDEYGQPYIAHALKNHKYLMKIGEGTKARYLYTQAEVSAYLQGLKRNVTGKAESINKRQIEKKNDRAGLHLGRKRNITGKADTSNIDKREHEKFTGSYGRKRNVTGKADTTNIDKRKKKVKEITDYVKKMEDDRREEVDWASPNSVQLKDYITGGEEKKNYKQAKKTERKNARELKKVYRELDKANAHLEKTKTKRVKNQINYDQSPKSRNTKDDEYAEDIQKTKSKIASTERKLKGAQRKEANSAVKLDRAEMEYESTSLPGTLHYGTKKTKRKVNSLINRLGKTPVSVSKKH